MLLVASLAAACGQEPYRVLPLPIKGADAGVDGRTGGDGDSDADGDGDADADPDGEPDPRACEDDRDCVIAVDLDVCCACARAVTVEVEAADPCLEPLAAGQATAACAVECRSCPAPACPVPRAALCRDQECVVAYQGECVDASDCPRGESCRFIEGETRCIGPVAGSCKGDDDCEAGSYCPAGRAGETTCEPLEPGECVRPEDCGGAPCDRLDAYVPGACRT